MNTIILSKPFSCYGFSLISEAYFFYLLLSQFSSSCSRASLPPFGNLVRDIVGWSSKEKMLMVNTRRVVAAMANTQSFWNWTVCYLVGQAVGVNANAMLRENETI